MTVQVLNMAVLSGKPCLDKETQTCLQVAEKVLMEEKENTLFWHFWHIRSFKSEMAMAPHSSTLAWKIPWMEEPGGLLRVGQDWATSLSLFTVMHWRRKWQPTPVLLPGESQGRGSLVGCCLWGQTQLKRLSSSSSIPLSLFLIGGQCFIMFYVGFCPTSTWISHRYAYVPFLLNLPLTSHPSRSSRSGFERPVSHSEFPGAIYFTYGNVYVSVLLSQCIPPSTSLTVTHTFFTVFFLPETVLASEYSVMNSI